MISDLIQDGLREEILAGKLPPGTRLVETKLARKFNASRTPVRRALNNLLHEGLVQKSVSGGFVVSQTSVKEIEEVVGLRRVLEAYALQLALPNIDDTDILQLELLIKQSELYAERGQPDEVFRLNTLFHDCLVNKSGNGRLIGILNQLMVSILYYRKVVLKAPDNVGGVIERHRAIIRALKDSNHERAIAALTADIDASLEILGNVFQERQID